MIFKKIYVILIMGLTLVFLINSNKKLNLELYDESVITSHNTINVNEESDEINKAIDTVVKYTVGGEDSDEASEENNIDLSDFSIGRNAEVKEPDYSNYEAEESPEESEEHSDDYEADYSEYVKRIRKEKHKQHKFSKDMEEY